MRRLALLSGLIFVLAAAPPAAAKHMRSVTACGKAACVTSEDRTLLTVFVDIGPPADRPARPAPFYRLKTRIQGSRYAGQGFWAPAANRLLGEDGTWMAVRPAVSRALAHLTAGLAPRPAAQLPGFPDVTTAGPDDRSTPATVWIAIAAAAAGFVVALVLLVRAAQAATSTGAAGAGRANR
jgi:hypothetical protein